MSKHNIGNIQINGCVSCGKPCDDESHICKDCYNSLTDYTCTPQRPYHLQETEKDIKSNVGCVMAGVLGLIATTTVVFIVFSFVGFILMLLGK